MIDVAPFLDALVAWVRLVLPANPVALSSGPRMMQASIPVARIEIDEPSSIRRIGEDWVTLADSVDGPIETVNGNRELDVMLRAIGRSHAGGRNASIAMETLRSSLKRWNVLAQLSAAGIAVVRTAPMACFNAPNSGREESIYALPITFGAAMVLTNPAFAGQIDAAVVTSEVSSITGDTLSAPPNVTDEVIGG